ncbi:uncharacterized protein LOC124923792 isoform X2 [Impatiens glandulifera]|uniref:uncharacterized protein LOC124923792 isoform X2 n=1 Tax=Impatiens glandulifera TaxID=253017 RepID=UPI001FB1128D|nr:uncharacterized protein LOC124923792 isoform X2 [Impatiens glandulifera]
MAASSNGVGAQFDLWMRTKVALSLSQNNEIVQWNKSKKICFPVKCGREVCSIKFCRSDSLVSIRRNAGSEKSEDWRARIQAASPSSFASPHFLLHQYDLNNSAPTGSYVCFFFMDPNSCRPRFHHKQEKFYFHCTPRNSGPRSGDSPPKRDTGIANEKDWGIDMVNENVNEKGSNEDGSTWYRETGEDVGENGYRCRWARMGGQHLDGSSEWKELWWEKSDWTGYKELGVEKSGKNAEGDSWWETWQEVLHQDEWSNLARIERSAEKQAKSGTENAGWYEKWWEKYDAKGWTEKGAHKYGRLDQQSWWEKWGENYDGRGSILKWTDKWAETERGTKWGDKWEEKFFAGIGSRQGETWHASPNGERWSRTWGEEHLGNGKVHKYGKSTSGENWDIVMDEETHYDAEPHYGWAEVVGDSVQLLTIEPREKPPGFFSTIDFRSSSSPSPPDENDI